MPARSPRQPKTKSASRHHSAIMRPPYLDAILEGRKTVESRLSLTRRDPFEKVAAGELIYFKESGGPYRAVARVERVEFFRDLERADVERLARRFNAEVCGTAAYWRGKRSARYATFIWLSNVREIDRGPAWRPMGRGWMTFEGSAKFGAPARDRETSQAR